MCEELAEGCYLKVCELGEMKLHQFHCSQLYFRGRELNPRPSESQVLCPNHYATGR